MQVPMELPHHRTNPLHPSPSPKPPQAQPWDHPWSNHHPWDERYPHPGLGAKPWGPPIPEEGPQAAVPGAAPGAAGTCWALRERLPHAAPPLACLLPSAAVIKKLNFHLLSHSRLSRRLRVPPLPGKRRPRLPPGMRPMRVTTPSSFSRCCLLQWILQSLVESWGTPLLAVHGHGGDSAGVMLAFFGVHNPSPVCCHSQTGGAGFYSPWGE